MKKRMELFKKFTLMIALTMLLTSVFGNVRVAHATESGTTEVSTPTGGIGDLDISMDEDGTIKIGGIDDGDGKSSVLKIVMKYKEVAVALSLIGCITCFIFFIINLLKLAGSGDNPQARRSAIAGLICTFIGCAGLGSVTVLVAVSWNAFK